MDCLNGDLSSCSRVYSCNPDLISMTKVGEEYRTLFNITYTPTRTLNALPFWVEEWNWDPTNRAIVGKESAFINVEINSWRWLKDLIFVLLNFIHDEGRVFIDILCHKSFEAPFSYIHFLLRSFVKPVTLTYRIWGRNSCRSYLKPISIKHPVLLVPEIIPFIVNSRLIEWIIRFVVD